MNENNKILAVKQCDNCGRDVEIRHKARLLHKNIFCCKQCESEYKISHNPNYINCPICGKKFYIKPSKKENSKINFCSLECMGKYRENAYLGENNPNYGNKGSKNPNWKSDEKINTYGYRLIRFVEHPFANSDGFVFEHRLVAEQYLLTDDNSVVINGTRYLSQDFQVHHIDKNPLNNCPENLQIVTMQEHAQLHGNEKKSKTTLICQYCHKEYNVVKSREEVSKFCSQECYKKFRETHKKGAEMTCPVCNTVFYTTDTHRTCCSTECSNIYNNRGTSIVSCSNCSKKFTIKNSRLSKSSQVFCSRTCYFEFKKQSTDVKNNNTIGEV